MFFTILPQKPLLSFSLCYISLFTCSSCSACIFCLLYNEPTYQSFPSFSYRKQAAYLINSFYSCSNNNFYCQILAQFSYLTVRACSISFLTSYVPCSIEELPIFCSFIYAFMCQMASLWVDSYLLQSCSAACNLLIHPCCSSALLVIYLTFSSYAVYSLARSYDFAASSLFFLRWSPSCRLVFCKLDSNCLLPSTSYFRQQSLVFFSLTASAYALDECSLMDRSELNLWLQLQAQQEIQFSKTRIFSSRCLRCRLLQRGVSLSTSSWRVWRSISSQMTFRLTIIEILLLSHNNAETLVISCHHQILLGTSLLLYSYYCITSSTLTYCSLQNFTTYCFYSLSSLLLYTVHISPLSLCLVSFLDTSNHG